MHVRKQAHHQHEISRVSVRTCSSSSTTRPMGAQHIISSNLNKEEHHGREKVRSPNLQLQRHGRKGVLLGQLPERDIIREAVPLQPPRLQRKTFIDKAAPIPTCRQNERSQLPRRLHRARGRPDVTTIARPGVYADLDRTITPPYARVSITS
jgi:hypothetical protein